jgi:Ser/Thr protein kinase RdoA (MazF antagonist)
LLAQVCVAFDLGTLSNAYDLGGTYNLNALLVSPTRKYVLRVYRPWVTPERLGYIQQTRKTLAQMGLPIPQPLARPTGETMLALEGRLVEVEPFVAHDHTADSWNRYAKAFALLGSLHDALAATTSAPFIPPRVSNYGTPPQLLRWVANTERMLHEESDVSASTQALATCREARDLLLVMDDLWQRTAPSLLTQPIHGDYGGGNILLGTNREIFCCSQSIVSKALEGYCLCSYESGFSASFC